MTRTGGPGQYDWSQPVAPSGLACWLADHRLVTRVALVVIDVVLLVLAVTGLHSSGRHWTAFLTLFSWLLLTVSSGWITPRQVDAWRQREGKPNQGMSPHP